MMPKDRPTKSDKEGLKQLPKPIQLNLPNSPAKPARRLHEPALADQSPRDNKKNSQKPPPSREAKNSDPSSGKRFFDSAQKTYGQRRPRAPKAASAPKRRWWQNTPSGPILGQGDRLYTPPQPKEPRLSPKARRMIRLWPLGIIGVAIVVMALINVFSYNAWAVYLDDEFLGHMPINREVEPESIHQDAVRHLQDFLGAIVQVNEEAVVRTARAGRREIYSAQDMIRRISQNFTYQIMASVIYLDGERVAVLRNETEAQHVANEITRRFTNDYTLLHLTTFEEDWQVISMAVDVECMDEDMDSPDEVIQLLERPIQDIHRHVIRSGDTQGALAIEFNTTVNMIGYLNDIPSDAILGVGNILLIEITRPRLTVRTVDEITSIEIIPMEVEERENPNMLVSLYEEITPGRDGEVELVQRITRLNGVQVGAPEVMSRRELSSAITRVIEVGTLETAIQTR